MRNIRGIYVIENNINNKKYVGLSKDIKRRWSEHRRELENNIHHNKHLQQAWNKYSAEAFSFRVIYLAKESEDLGELEKKFIEKYDSYLNGYNCTPGGEGTDDFGHGSANTNAKLTERDVVAILIRKFNGESQSSISKDYNIARSTIGDICANRKWKHISRELDKLNELAKEYGLNMFIDKDNSISKTQKGTANSNAKLTEKDVVIILIRSFYGEKIKDIAKDYTNVARSTIRDICSNRKWKHIPRDINKLKQMAACY